MEKAREFQKSIYLCSTDYAKACVVHSKPHWLCGSKQIVENSQRDRNTRPPYLIMRNLHAGQEAIFRNGHRITCVHAKSLQSCLSLCDPIDCSPQGSSVLEILHARILEWVIILFSRGSSQSRDQDCISYISSALAGGLLTISTTCTWKNRLVQNWERRTSRPYIITLLI